MTDSLSQAQVNELLMEVIGGDISHIDSLRRASQDQLHAAGQAGGAPLVLSRPSVRRVVEDWRDGKLTDEQVRWWGLLMTIGAFPQEWNPYGWHVHHSHQPLDIDYTDEVAEVLSRLRDLGDFDDAGRAGADFDHMIRQLSDS